MSSWSVGHQLVCIPWLFYLLHSLTSFYNR
jgi:hypothetical protein